MTKDGSVFPDRKFFRLYKKIVQINIDRDDAVLADYATPNREGVRLGEEKYPDMKNLRPAFFHDTDRIIHCRAYARYIDKTQVFFEVRNDHISRRVLHVQLVSKIGRTLARFFRANEDLVEAIALGHDLGHAPFGHAGETFIAEKLEEHGAGNFVHNAQSVRMLQYLENSGKGLNLTLQTLDGILGHNGEMNDEKLFFDKSRLSWEKLRQDTKNCFEQKHKDKPERQVFPSTVEGAVVRLSDVIAYLGRDIEDAVTLEKITREQLPKQVVGVLGNNNRAIINNLAMDIVHNSEPHEGRLAFSPEVQEAKKLLYEFNYQNIYMSDQMKTARHTVQEKIHRLFDLYLDDLEKDNVSSLIFAHYLNEKPASYREENSSPRIVADFIAGMTDRYLDDEVENRLSP